MRTILNDNTLPSGPLHPTNCFCRLRENAVSLFQINRVYYVMFFQERFSRGGKKIRGCRDLIKPGSYICIWITNGYFTVESLKRPLGLHVIIVSESKFKSSAFSVRLFSLTRFVTCNAIIQFDAVFNTQPLAQWIWKKTCCPQAEGNKERVISPFFLHLSYLTFRTGPRKF